MTTVSTALRQVLAGLAVLLALTVVLGVAYPAAVWGVSRLGAHSAEGSALVDADGCVVGSALTAVDPVVADGQPDPFFHPRVTGSLTGGADGGPDAFAAGDPSAALPLNQGPSSELLAAMVDARRAAVAQRENVDPAEVPVDAVTGSGSGVDPDISPAYAALQVSRVAAATGLSDAEVRARVQENTSGRTLGVLGEPAVHVPALNVALGLTAPGCGTSATDGG
ncbi:MULTISPECIES: potassium-transporting ATPase subunit C [unclassified Rhodococcus (in: high G+C Gram-positive bacteria)]|uniref:potassium-transporting ATPase subunit C n=1 Tax=unclassified Rhodococcus (in: high G+C Gram-positive bacteria) TaxID=192944 RepID=UPI001C9A9DEA|nr:MULTISPECIES: potassium-transporting ATPase subunit C [unclassified Rhodococcus (in: high G+C Gram-positive bacteria)]